MAGLNAVFIKPPSGRRSQTSYAELLRIPALARAHQRRNAVLRAQQIFHPPDGRPDDLRFCAVSVIYTLAIDGSFDDLLLLSEDLYDNEVLLADSRLRIDQLLKVIGDAASQAHASPVVEDYVVFHVESFAQPVHLSLLCSEHSQRIAQILRAERREQSDQEVERRPHDASFLQSE